MMAIIASIMCVDLYTTEECAAFVDEFFCAK